MKRGFLNTDEAKRKLAAVSDGHPTGASDPTVSEDKGKAKVEIPVDAFRPSLPLLDLHSIPPTLRSNKHHPDGHNRIIFRQWPRDPNGKYILPSDIHGKEAGNYLDLWGATLYDFYFVRRIPDNTNALTISTGSKLTKVMQAFGEFEHAKDELAWAGREADPREIPAWDPAQAIVAYERRVHAGCGAKKVDKEESASVEASAEAPEADAQMLDVPEQVADPASGKAAVANNSDSTPRVSVDESDGKSADSMDESDSQHPQSDIPVESPFHPSHYPSPWPFVPFETPYTPFVLRRRIPFYLLPKKLHVHDPWNLVHTRSASSSSRRDEEKQQKKGKEELWTSKTEHVRTYTLFLPPDLYSVAQHLLRDLADPAREPVETVFINPRETEGPAEQPAIRVFLPKRPPKLIEVPEAHLYLSPKGRLGTGNHSIVYEAELELPRDLFCESTYCKSCLDEQIKAEIDRLRASGEWEQRLNEAAQAYDGPRKHNAASCDSLLSSSVQIPPRYVGFVKVRFEHTPVETMEISTHFVRVSDSVTNRYVEYEGLVIPVHPNIQWQNPSYPETICEHQMKKKKPVPRTAMFRVAAKLSLPGDRHLAREAKNYLKFPSHFFQHWSGYNVVPPLHDPTPIGALVPQFFGYYTPDDRDDENVYCSPILLIEHCGKPVTLHKLSTDDRHECAALLFRFQSAGWLHESFAERNILMQKQQPTCSPLEEEDECTFPHKHRKYSFRLIDFGRSVKYTEASNRAVEESQGRMLFGLL